MSKGASAMPQLPRVFFSGDTSWIFGLSKKDLKGLDTNGIVCIFRILGLGVYTQAMQDIGLTGGSVVASVTRFEHVIASLLRYSRHKPYHTSTAPSENIDTRRIHTSVVKDYVKSLRADMPASSTPPCRHADKGAIGKAPPTGGGRRFTIQEQFLATELATVDFFGLSQADVCRLSESGVGALFVALGLGCYIPALMKIPVSGTMLWATHKNTVDITRTLQHSITEGPSVSPADDVAAYARAVVLASYLQDRAPHTQPA